MSMQFPGSATLVAANTSAENDGATVTAGGATLQAGTDAGTNGKYIQLRFDTSAIPADHYPFLELQVVLSANSTPTQAFDLWTREYGAAITTADYGQALNVTAGSRARRIGRMIPAGTLASGTVYKLDVAPDYVAKGVGALTDLEIRPANSTEPAAGDTITIHGPAATNAALRPTLVGYAFTIDELSDENARHFNTDGTRGQITCALESAEPGKGGARRQTFVLPTTPGAAVNIDASNLMSNVRDDYPGIFGNVAAGPVASTASLPMEPHLSTLLPLLRNFMTHRTTPTTADVGGVTVLSGTLYQVRRPRDAAFITMIERVNDWHYRGFQRGVIQDVSLASSFGEVTRANVNLAGIHPVVWDDSAAGQEGQALYADTLIRALSRPGVYHGIQIEFDNQSGGLKILGDQVRSVNLSIATGSGVIGTLNQERGAGRAYIGDNALTASFGLLLTSPGILDAAMANGKTYGSPRKPGKNPITATLKIKFIGDAGENVDMIEFVIPKATITATPSPISENGRPLEVNVSVAASKDPSLLGSFYINYKAPIAASTLEPQTDDRSLIHVMPDGYRIGY